MQSLHAEIERDLGFGLVPNLFREADAAPDVARGLWEAFRGVVMQGELPRTVKEMMGVMVSVRAGSPYAAQVHLHALTLQGTDQTILRALERGEIALGLPEPQRRLLAFAAQPERALLDGHFSETEIREAVATVGVYRWINLWTDTLAVPIDPL